MVLIVVDDLNTRVGAWGAPVKTPAIDRLAARGVRFDRAYAQVAMCSPSRVSMLTGWLPERTGVWQNEDPPRPPRAVPLQELFAAHGAVTAGIGKIYHSPADFHWEIPEAQLDEPEEHPDVVEAGGPGASGDPAAELWVNAPGADADQPDGRRARRAVSLVERQRARPFFLALGLVRPHRRWIAPARYFDLYPPDSIVVTPSPDDDLADVPAIAVKTQPQPLPGLPLLGREPPGLVRDARLRRQAIAAYQACVSFADAQVGLVLDALDRRDRWQDTVVVLVGDNGFHLGEHGGLLRKDTLFEEALRVPLVVAAPGLPHPGAVVRAPVELLDVYPTIVELAGLTPPSDLDGQSLVPLLENPEGAGRGIARSWRRVQPPERGVSLRTERFRYTLWPDGSEELYDRRGRGPESENLAANPKWLAEKARLRARLEALVAPLAVTRLAPRMMPVLLRLDRVTKDYSEGRELRHVLKDAWLSVDEGEVVAIRGRSGSGKSTVLNLVAGIDRPTSGEIFFGETALGRLSPRERTLLRRDHMGFVFQFFNLIPTLSVIENVLLPAELAGVHGARPRALELLERVGLGDRPGAFPDRLSGGEQQRVAIARALVRDPRLVLADEPTGNLDDAAGAAVMELLDSVTRRAGKTLLLVTHSREVAALADRELTIEGGRFV